MATICPCCHQTVADGDFLVSLDAAKVSRFGKTVHLLPQEVKLLAELNSASPGVAKHKDLIYALYGYSHGPLDPIRTVQVVMSRLRKKISPLGAEVETIVNSGYRLDLSQPNGDR